MAISTTGMALENEHVGPNWKPTLGAAFEVFHAQWKSGERDRELALHLMFLAWYLYIEPSYLTGLEEGRISHDSLAAVFNAAHDWLLPTGADTDDIEALYTAGLPARMFPWALGDHVLWTVRSEVYRLRYRQLAPGGISPDVFEGRGAYGEYFADQACVVGGY